MNVACVKPSVGSDSSFLDETLALVWKYWRETQVLMLVLGIIPSLLAVFFVANTHPAPPPIVVPFVSAALFALAFGALAFAGETERKTETLLRALPVKASRLVLAVSAVAFLGVAVCLSIGFVILIARGWIIDDQSLFQEWPWDVYLGVLFWAGLAAEFFVCGLFFSIFVRRVIWSALLGATVAYILNSLIVVGFDNLFQTLFLNRFIIPKIGSFTWGTSGELLPVHLLVAAGVLMIDAILVGKWLKSPDEPLRWLKSRLLFLRFRGISAPVRVRQIVSRFAIPKIPNLSASPMKYLVWLHECHLGGWALFLKMSLFVYILILVCISFLSTQWLSTDAFREWCKNHGLSVLIFVPSMAIVMMGISTFIFDRGLNRNFLAALPTAPQSIWWSRQRWAFPWLVAWCGAWILSDAILRDFHGYSPLTRNIQPPPTWLLYALSTTSWYATGQLAGMASPNIIQAFVVALFLVFFGGYLPGQLFPVGRDELWPGLALVLQSALFSIGVLAQTRVSIGHWLKRHIDNLWSTIALSPLLWTLIGVWFVLPALRVYFIRGPQWSQFTDLQSSVTAIKDSMWLAIGDRRAPGPVHTTTVLKTLDELERDYRAWSAAAYTRTDEDYSGLLWSRVSRIPNFLEHLAELTKTPYSDPFVARLFNVLSERAESAGNDTLVSDPFLHHALFERLTYEAIERGNLEYARIFFTADLCLSLRARRTQPAIVADRTVHSLDIEHEWKAWADTVWAWCHAPGQTSQGIYSALREVYDIWKKERIPFDERIPIMYHYWRDFALKTNSSDNKLYSCAPMGWILLSPGEKAVLQKRLDRIFSEWLPIAWQYEADRLLPGADREILDDSPFMEASTFLTYRPAWINWYVYQEFLNQQTIDLTVRVTLLRMAIRAYELDHGRLPDRLTDLTSQYLPVVPRLPGTGDEFIYFPRGVKASKTQYPKLDEPCLVVPGLLGIVRDGWPTEADRHAQAVRGSWPWVFPESGALVVWSLSPPARLDNRPPQIDNR